MSLATNTFSWLPAMPQITTCALQYLDLMGNSQIPLHQQYGRDFARVTGMPSLEYRSVLDEGAVSSHCGSLSLLNFLVCLSVKLQKWTAEVCLPLTWDRVELGAEFTSVDLYNYKIAGVSKEQCLCCAQHKMFDSWKCTRDILSLPCKRILLSLCIVREFSAVYFLAMLHPMRASCKPSCTFHC